MGLVISTQGVIQSSQSRNVVSQIKADVLALLDARYYAKEYNAGDRVGPLNVHGNSLPVYKHLRASTNVNNPNLPLMSADQSLRFSGDSSLRTDTFTLLKKEFTCAFVLKLDDDSAGGMLFRLGNPSDASSSKNILYSANNKTLSFRQNISNIITISDFDPNKTNGYFLIIVSASANQTMMVVGDGGILSGVPVALEANYLQLMSGDHASDKVTGNLKYFSWYDGAATKEEILKLQQILKQNFNL